MTTERKAQPASGNVCGRKNGEKYLAMDDRGKELGRPSLLLHSCCGPCSTSVIERLAPDYDITVFFYNPNITDEEEYERRKAAQKSFIRQYNEDPDIPYKVDFKEGAHDSRNFFEACRGMENEPEGGRRCEVCFRLRLEKTAETANLMNFDTFGTTLTVSPHKNYELISRLGRQLAARYRVSFLDEDFKKKAGFQRSIELSKKYGLYRQNYCGCDFSKYEDR